MKDLTIAELHHQIKAKQVKGFLANDEAEALWQMAQEVGHLGPCLEIGSYCGKSTVYLADGCRRCGSALYALDHHRGSEEHQVGEEYHDPDLFSERQQRMDSFPEFRRTVEAFDLVDWVIPLVNQSAIVARHWGTPLSLVFVDGGHSPAMSMQDCIEWSRFIVPGGVLAVHDLFEHPEEGGQGPYLAVQQVLHNGDFEWLFQMNSLGFLRRLDSPSKEAKGRAGA